MLCSLIRRRLFSPYNFPFSLTYPSRFVSFVYRCPFSNPILLFACNTPLPSCFNLPPAVLQDALLFVGFFSGAEVSALLNG